jgi:hypothetical protein
MGDDMTRFLEDFSQAIASRTGGDAAKIASLVERLIKEEVDRVVANPDISLLLPDDQSNGDLGCDLKSNM